MSVEYTLQYHFSEVAIFARIFDEYWIIIAVQESVFLPPYKNIYMGQSIQESTK